MDSREQAAVTRMMQPASNIPTKSRIEFLDADMPPKSLIATLAFVVVLIALTGATCGGGLSPIEALAASRDSFNEIQSFQVRFQVTIGTVDLGTTTEGQAAYQSEHLAFSTMSLTGSAPSEQEFNEVLFIPPDLYFRASDGRWFVLSPWNQGIRPDELPDPDLDNQIIDYDRIASELYDIEQLSDETIDGVEYLRYAGTIDLIDPIDVEEFASAAPPGHFGVRRSHNSQGTAQVKLWLRKESYLPHKMQITPSLPGGISGFTDATFEFFDYNRQITPPQRPADARPWRDLQLPEAPCTGSAFAQCLEAQTELQSIALDSCAGSGRRVCLVPFGQVSPALVQHLVDHYRDQYGLTVTVLSPSGVPPEISNPLREQVDAVTLIAHMGSLFPDAFVDPQAVLIGLTPADLYNSSSHFRYVFGVKGVPEDPKAVISTFRMNPETYGEPPSDELLFSRTRKLLTKYIGLLFYGLPPSEDPLSPLYDSILGPADLDNMGEPLPIPPAN